MGTSLPNRDAVPSIVPEIGPEKLQASRRRAILIAAVGLSACTVWLLRSLIPAILLGCWLAAVTEPLSARIARRLGGRSRAASVVTLTLVFALLLAASLLVLPIVMDASAAIAAVRHLLQEGQGLRSLAPLGPGMPTLPMVHNPSGPPLLDLAQSIAPLAGAALELFMSGAIQVVVFIVTAYYLVIDGRRLRTGIESVSPLGPKYTRAFIREFIAVGRGIALSVGVTGVATTAALGTAFVALGAPRPLLLTAVVFVASLLPTGAHIVWIPVAGWFAYYGQTQSALVLATVGVVVVGGVIDHVLRPYLVRYGKLEMHPLLTALGMFGGVLAIGFWGVFLGPLLVAMTSTALRLHARRAIMSRRSLIPGERVTEVPGNSIVVPAPVEPMAPGAAL